MAHIYGQNIAAAESMTAAAAPWAWSPATLKPTADQEFLNGINRFVIHESAHQPLIGKNKAPGMTLGPFGQWFNRNETWADQAGAWIDYLARTSFMLQQGHFGADLLYFYGEDSNLTAIFAAQLARYSRRLRLRLHQRRRADSRTQREQRPHHHQERHELPSAGARSIQQAHVAARAQGD